MPEPAYIACVPWGEQCVPSGKFACIACQCEVALDVMNIDKVNEMGAQTMCLTCASKRFSDIPDAQFSALCDGRKITVSTSLVDKFRNYFKKIN